MTWSGSPESSNDSTSEWADEVFGEPEYQPLPRVTCPKCIAISVKYPRICLNCMIQANMAAVELRAKRDQAALEKDDHFDGWVPTDEEIDEMARRQS